MHKYSHKEEGQKEIEEFSKKNEVYFRNLSKEKNKWTTSEEKITGSFKSFEEVKNLLIKLPKNSSTTILFHPGKLDLKSKSSFNKDRIEDIKNILLLNKFIDTNNKEYQKIRYIDLEK